MGLGRATCSPTRESCDIMGMSYLGHFWSYLVLVTWEVRTPNKGRRQHSLSLTTNFSQNVTEPFKGISYPVGDLCRRFTKLTGSSAYTLHSNPISPDGTNGLL